MISIAVSAQRHPAAVVRALSDGRPARAELSGLWWLALATRLTASNQQTERIATAKGARETIDRRHSTDLAATHR